MIRRTRHGRCHKHADVPVTGPAASMFALDDHTHRPARISISPRRPRSRPTTGSRNLVAFVSRVAITITGLSALSLYIAFINNIGDAANNRNIQFRGTKAITSPFRSVGTHAHDDKNVHDEHPSVSGKYQRSSEARGSSANSDKVKASVSSLSDDSTSACLITMDDNHFLVEWLAYHYHVLKLRHLIVAVDPQSTTSPEQIFKRWEGLMTIETWYDEERYLDTQGFQKRVAERMQEYSDREAENENLSAHRTRKWEFNMECMKTLKKLSKGWVFLTDTDEYIYTNPRIKEKTDELYMSKWDGLPTIREPGSVHTLLKQLALPSKKYDTNMAYPCVRVARRQFSACEVAGKTRYYEGDSSFNVSGEKFQTLRWKKWGYLNEYHPELPGKAMIDLTRVRLIDLEDENNEGDPHRPLGTICSEDEVFVGEKDTLLLANHYMGTREQWEFRENDARGFDCLRNLYDHQNNIIGKYESDYVSQWLEGFIDNVGVDEAMRLLNGVGEVEPKAADEATDPKHAPPIIPQESKVKAGDRVMAYYEDDEKWYPATVVASNCRGGYDIKYDEDDSWDWNLRLKDMVLIKNTGESAQSSSIDSSSPDTLPSATRPCALLFFGLARHFADIAYPSIRKYVLDFNPSCNVFVHTFNVTDDQGNRFRDRDSSGVSTAVKPEEMLLLAKGKDFIMFETEADFLRQHDLGYYRMRFPRPSSWEYPASMDNMIRQWHSIEAAWSLMQKYEEKYHFAYERVGLLRGDVLYMHPIDITDGDAVIPSMMYECTAWCGYNDRLFYGLRRYAATWATQRFDSVRRYLAEQSNNSEYDETEEFSQRRGLHSEDFLRYLVTKRRKIPIQIKDMCFQRIRSWGEIFEDDCDLIPDNK